MEKAEVVPVQNFDLFFAQESKKCASFRLDCNFGCAFDITDVTRPEFEDFNILMLRLRAPWPMPAIVNFIARVEIPNSKCAVAGGRDEHFAQRV